MIISKTGQLRDFGSVTGLTREEGKAVKQGALVTIKYPVQKWGLPVYARVIYSGRYHFRSYKDGPICTEINFKWYDWKKDLRKGEEIDTIALRIVDDYVRKGIRPPSLRRVKMELKMNRCRRKEIENAKKRGMELRMAFKQKAHSLGISIDDARDIVQMAS